MAVSVNESISWMAADADTDTSDPATVEQVDPAEAFALLDVLDISPARSLSTHEVIKKYQDMVYRIALTHTSCQSDADDVFQDAFLAYHRRQPAFTTEGTRKGWLITTALNCARHQASTSWRTRVVPLRPEDAERLPSSRVFTFQTETQDQVFRVLTQLPVQYRSVLHLFYFEDLSIAQIAGVLGEREGAVKMRLSRARELMRTTMEGHFDE
jgi:RNA polymerase sigma-70 factor (ECF subfamily)